MTLQAGKRALLGQHNVRQLPAGLQLVNSLQLQLSLIILVKGIHQIFSKFIIKLGIQDNGFCPCVLYRSRLLAAASRQYSGQYQH